MRRPHRKLASLAASRSGGREADLPSPERWSAYPRPPHRDMRPISAMPDPAASIPQRRAIFERAVRLGCAGSDRRASVGSCAEAWRQGLLGLQAAPNPASMPGTAPGSVLDNRDSFWQNPVHGRACPRTFAAILDRMKRSEPLTVRTSRFCTARGDARPYRSGSAAKPAHDRPAPIADATTPPP